MDKRFFVGRDEWLFSYAFDNDQGSSLRGGEGGTLKGFVDSALLGGTMPS
jgi:hypothetical protein